MADQSLDDFFAKKDKKKSKSRSGDGEDGKSKKEKKKDKSGNKLSTNSSSNKGPDGIKGDDDEWNDFEEEKAADYSNLRIQTLQQKDDSERDVEGVEEEYDENGSDKREGSSGPWNKTSSAPAAPIIEEVKPAPAPVNTGKYIPPSQRAAMAAAASGASSGGPSSRRKKVLPNIQSNVDFPTLASGPGSDNQQTMDAPNQRRAVNLTLENKFSVLQD